MRIVDKVASEQSDSEYDSFIYTCIYLQKAEFEAGALV